ncbi:MAG: 2-hydroxychromene-2-carboxylate isomerase [Deltaproteobacteria bacterium]|nr:MAG: 2-hydroxychromene-2-carboxylate isomerase [Deltaproteobacteria bacterium]
MARPTVTFLFDFASPFSYIADVRVDRELATLPVDVVRVPVYLRGFDAFRAGSPYSAAKAAYLAADLVRCAARAGVPLGAPARVPVDGLHMLRAYLALDGHPAQAAFRRAAFRATWVDGADTSDPEVVVEVGESAGIDRRELAAGMARPAVKAALRANTDRAIERGAFGVPTFFVGDELYWGQDRLDFVRERVEAAACGGAIVSDVD